MSEARHDPALEEPGIGSHTQHVHVVVRFKEESVASAQMADYRVVGMPEVTGDTHTSAVAGFDDETRGIVRVVKRPAGVDIQLADGERAVVVENDDRRFLPVDRAGVERASRQVDRDRKFSSDALRSANMVVVLMRQDDRPQVRELAADLLQTLGRLARTESGIDKDARAVTLEIIGIPRATRSQRRNKHKNMVAQKYNRAACRWNDSSSKAGDGSKAPFVPAATRTPRCRSSRPAC